MGALRRQLVALLAVLGLSGCPHDFTLPPGREGGADRAAGERDLPGPDRGSDQRRADTVRPPDRGCPSPCVTTFAGRGQVAGLQDGPLDQALFDWPTSIALHPGGLLVADKSNFRVRLIAGGKVVTYAGTVVGSDDGPIASAQLQSPQGVTVNGTDVYVSDLFRLRKISAGQVTTVAGSSNAWGFVDGPATAALFGQPQGLAYHAALGLLVADPLNDRIRRVTGGQVSTLVGGQSGFLDGPTSVALLDHPSDVVVDSAGNLYIADMYNNRIRRVVNGVVETLAGSGLFGFADGPAGQAMFSSPTGLAIEAGGAVLVADSANHRIRRIAGAMVTTFAGSGAPGYLDGPATSARFNDPEDVTVDAAGAIYVVDTGNNCIRRIY